MSISVAIDPDPTALDVDVTDDFVRITLSDGREISAPLAWFPHLRDASAAARRGWEMVGRGHGLHWPELDEDISIRTLMGRPS